MRNFLSLLIPLLGVSLFGEAEAAMNCPPMPAAMTQLGHNVNVEINASVGRLGPVKAGEVGSKVSVEAKALFEKFPNVDKLLALQTMSSSYCQMIISASISDAERLDRWERFQARVLGFEGSASH